MAGFFLFQPLVCWTQFCSRSLARSEVDGERGAAFFSGTVALEGRFLLPERVCACLSSDLVSERNENPAEELLSGRNREVREGVH